MRSLHRKRRLGNFISGEGNRTLIRATRLLRPLILILLIVFGILQFLAPFSRAASPSLSDNPTTTQKAVTYITDVVGKRVRIVGRAFIPTLPVASLFRDGSMAYPGIRYPRLNLAIRVAFPRDNTVTGA
jgi:hypothetical protein